MAKGTFVKSSAITFERVAAIDEAIKNVMADIATVLEMETLADKNDTSSHPNSLEDIYGELSQAEMHTSKLKKRIATKSD